MSFQTEQCQNSWFNESEIIECNEYVFKTDEYRIMREVNENTVFSTFKIFIRLIYSIFIHNYSLVFCVMKTSINWRS